MGVTTVLRRPDPNSPWRDERYITLHRTEDSVSLLDSILRKGVNKHSGKTWARFEGTRTTIKRTEVNGQQRINVWKVSPRTFFKIENVTPRVGNGLYGPLGHSQGTTELISQFFDLIDHHGRPATSDEVERLCYPMLTHNETWKYASGLGRALRLSDQRQFVEAAFGKTRYRKDLVRAIGNSSSLHPVAKAAMWRGLVPTDWLVEAIGTRGLATPLSGKQIITLRKVLANMTIESRKRLLLADRGQQWVADTIRSAQQILRGGDLGDFGRVESWRDIHDRLAGDARKYIEANKQIDQSSKVYKKLDGQVTPNGYTIVSAKDTDTLGDWGAEMSNCIGGYGHAATNGSTNLFGIYRDDVLVGNMEVTPKGDVRQLVAKYNARFPDYEDVADTVQALTGSRIARKLELAEFL